MNFFGSDYNGILGNVVNQAIDFLGKTKQKNIPEGNLFFKPVVNGLIVPGNIDLSKRPTVKNKDGSISTVRSMSINIDGKEVLIPTVSDDGRIMEDEEAIDMFRRTGRHLGIFSSPEEASSYAEQLHNEQANQYLK